MQNVKIGNTFSDGHPKKLVWGKCSIGNNDLISTGACILRNVRIGNNVKIGANAVVLSDVSENVVVVGVPGTIRRIGD